MTPFDLGLMRECPKWDSCSVPLCPLDPYWEIRAAPSSERLCPYLLEVSKPGFSAVLAGTLSGEVLAKVVEAHQTLIARPGAISKQLKRAAKSGSRITAGRARIAKLMESK